MSRKVQTGICKLCGRYGKLTFEHVPPKSAFNDSKVSFIKGEELINHISAGRMPSDITGIHKTIQQQGGGGYYLCGNCNSNSGSWYVDNYKMFVRGLCSVLTQEIYETADEIVIESGEFYPLPVIKQIILMFVNINAYGAFDKTIYDFLLNKERVPASDRKAICDCFLETLPAVSEDMEIIMKKLS